MPSPIRTLPTQILHTLQEAAEIQLRALNIPWSLQLEMIVASSSLSYDLNSDSLSNNTDLPATAATTPQPHNQE